MQIVVFVSGAVLMSLEMLGSRMLAPYFGNSIFVWGSLISVFLAALSVGYVVGGNYADKQPSLRSLAAILALPGALISLLPWLTEPLCLLFVDVDFGPRLSPLLAAMVLFFIPSVFMGMVSPLAIKLAVSELDTVGNTTGRLYAISALGSIVGTLGTSFFLITWMGVRLILHLLGAVLLLLALLVAVKAKTGSERQEKSAVAGKAGAKKGGRGAGKALLLIVSLCAASAVTSVEAAGIDIYASKKVYEKDSLYHHIVVADEGGVRYLKFDNSWQSAMDLKNPEKLVFDYTEYFHLGPLFYPGARTALFIGLGGGSVPKNFRVNYPELTMDAVEIDPEVIRVAERYFGVKPDEKLRLIARDGRIFLRRNNTRYDMVFLDAYYADAIPFHLVTREYMQELANHMSPQGVLVSNVIGAVSGPRSRMFRSIVKTYREVFPQVYAFPVGWTAPQRGDTLLRNIVIIGLRSSSPPDWSALQAAARTLAQSLAIPSDIPSWLASRLTDPIPTNDVPVLTDDYAPVDNLLHF